MSERTCQFDSDFAHKPGNIKFPGFFVLFRPMSPLCLIVAYLLDYQCIICLSMSLLGQRPLSFALVISQLRGRGDGTLQGQDLINGYVQNTFVQGKPLQTRVLCTKLAGNADLGRYSGCLYTKNVNEGQAGVQMRFVHGRGGR